MNVGSLFSGIGGIDLGLERAGFEVSWFCETNAYCRAVLDRHWPRVPVYRDIRELYEAPIPDLVCGGFPCQPFSAAGRKLGTDDERWLWPEFARVVGLLRPRYVLVENVPGLLAGHGGMGNVLGSLAALGYDAEWDCIPASAVGAPHQRDRVWIVAYAQSLRQSSRRRIFEGEWASKRWTLVGSGARTSGGDKPRDHSARGGKHRGDRVASSEEILADADKVGRDRWAGELWPAGWREPTDSNWWATEPDVGRVAHGVPSRLDRLAALGNAVVPQVAEWIGRRIIEAEEERVAA